MLQHRNMNLESDNIHNQNNVPVQKMVNQMSQKPSNILIEHSQTVEQINQCRMIYV